MNIKSILKSLIPTILVVFMAGCLPAVKPVEEPDRLADQQKWVEKTMKKMSLEEKNRAACNCPLSRGIL